MPMFVSGESGRKRGVKREKRNGRKREALSLVVVDVVEREKSEKCDDLSFVFLFIFFFALPSPFSWREQNKQMRRASSAEALASRRSLLRPRIERKVSTMPQPNRFFKEGGLSMARIKAREANSKSSTSSTQSFSVSALALDLSPSSSSSPCYYPEEALLAEGDFLDAATDKLLRKLKGLERASTVLARAKVAGLALR